MKHAWMAVMLLLAGAGVLSAQSPRALIRNIQGTVEVKAPGAPAWVAAEEGQVLEPEALISTGFNSAAVIEAGGSTVLVRSLTRMSIREAQAAAGADRVDIQLRTGRIRADVKPPAGGGRVNFTVRSPTATASVRGTVFEFDTVNLRVEEGTVAFSGSDGLTAYVAEGQVCAPDPVSGGTAAPVEIAAAQAPPLPVGLEETAAQAPPAIPVFPAEPPSGDAPPPPATPTEPFTVGLEWED
jgi:hypothetical protein